MPRPAGVTRISLTGHLSGGEIFDTSYWLGNSVGSEDAANACAAAVATILGDGGCDYLFAILAADQGYDEVRVYGYTAEGPSPATYVGSAPAVHVGTGGSGGNGLLQTCMVATLLTGLSGRQNRGRMYIPAPNIAVISGLTDDSQPASLAGAIGHLLSESNDNAAIPGPCVVVSSAGTHTHAITAVRVDNHPDIQRRRAESLAPSATHTTTVTS